MNYISLSFQKKLLLKLILSFFLVSSMSAQVSDTIFLDKDWEETKDRNEALFFRLIEKIDRKHTLVKDYYISGQLQMKGIYTKPNMEYRNGSFTFYQENGNIDVEGQYNRNDMTGIWKWYDKNGMLCAKEVYKNNERKSFTFYNEQGEIIPIEEAERPAEFPGGQQAFSYFVEKITDEDKIGKKRGKVIMELVIDKTGAINTVRVCSTPHKILSQEAFRIIKLLPKFRPAKQHNREEASVIDVTFDFRKRKKKK